MSTKRTGFTVADLFDEIRTLDEYRAYAVTRARKRDRAIVVDPRPLVPYINYGRWLADCHHCRGGIALDPEWPIAFCFGAGCYRSYTSILWPPQRVEIERALADRWLKRQHWNALGGMMRNPVIRGESIDDLHRENHDSTDGAAPPLSEQVEAIWVGLLR